MTRWLQSLLPRLRPLTATLLAALLVSGNVLSAAPARADAQTPDANDPRYFTQTNFRIDRDSFWDYFQKRGGVTTFGYPASRDFMFEGCTTQFFQRLIMQQCGTQGVGTLNLLDEGLLPYTGINGSVFPAPDLGIKAATPLVSDPSYGSAILDFVRANAPDQFDGEPVNFGKTFFGAVSADLAGTSEPNMLGLFDLELWGAPTSKPAYDPTNHNFIYQRFQRGIMHYDKGCGCTQGLLLADYLKAVITGDHLPGDLDAQAKNSPLYKSLKGKAPAGTVYGDAFTPLTGATTAQLPADSSTAVHMLSGSSPDYGLSMFLWGHKDTTARDLKLATDAGFHWQKTLFQWRDIEGAGKGQFNWSEADRVVKSTNAAGIKVIARLDEQPAWARKDGAHNGPPDNYQDYWDYVSALVSRYKTGSPNGTINAIEIWNEVNLKREWGDQPISAQQAADYVRFLTGAYKAAKAADPNVIVITAGLSPTGVRTSDAEDDVQYLQWLYTGGLKAGVNYDVLGAHGNTQAPEVDADFNSLPAFQDASFYFRRIEQLRSVMVQNGDAASQIWLLEFGWTSDMIHPAYSWFAVSEDKKASNVVKALQYARDHWSPWIGVMTLWTMADAGWTPDREEYWWAVTNPDGTTRPAYNAVKAARQSGLLP